MPPVVLAAPVKAWWRYNISSIPSEINAEQRPFDTRDTPRRIRYTNALWLAIEQVKTVTAGVHPERAGQFKPRFI
jgi:hypothetical protein